MSHPHVFPSAEYWLASRRGEKKAKQTQHIQILKKKKRVLQPSQKAQSP